MSADKDDKENALGAGQIPSVAERIAGLSLAGARKRRYEEEEEGVGEVEKATPKKLRGKMKPRSKPVAKKPVAKKPRLASPAPSTASVSSNESEDERTVEAELTAVVRFPSVQAAEEEDGFFSEQRSDIPQRTRGNGLRAAVASKAAQQVVPSEREHTQSLGSQSQSTARQVRKIDLSKMSLRRSTSIPEVLLNSVSGRKRKHGGSDEGEGSNKRGPIHHPLAGVRIGPPRHARRSFSLPSSDSDLGGTQPMSSDDDPHYGQVTPHNIISPAPSRRPGSFGGRYASSSRRYASQPFFKDLFGDDVPGSDDSVGGSSSASGSELESPTKVFVTRQLQRSGSSDALLKFASSSGSLAA